MKKTKTIALGAVLLLTGANLMKAQETQVKFFGQPEFQSERVTKKGNYFPNPPSPYPAWKDSTYTDSTKSAFTTGNFVLFVTSQLTERISVLSENTANIENGTPTFHVQRLMLRYFIKDYFSVRVGKMFNPIGYWNNQYNLGLVLQPTIQRSILIRTPEEGGVTQVNNVGVQFEGDNITKLRIFYRAFICNGNNTNNVESNLKNQFAFTGQLGVEPAEGLKLLVSAHYDHFSAGPGANLNVVRPKGGTTLSSQSAIAYMNPGKKLEFISEYSYHSTQMDSIGETASQGLSTYLGYKVTNKLIPYAQYVHVLAGSKNETDKFFVGTTDGIQAKLQNLCVGVRYKFTANFVVKFEYHYNVNSTIYQDKTFPLQNPLLPGYIAGDKVAKTITQGPRVQFAFAF